MSHLNEQPDDQVPPDGRCLYFCAAAAIHSERFLATPRDTDPYGSGLPWDPDDAEQESLQADTVMAQVISLLVRDGKLAQAQRLHLAGPAGYPGEDELPYLAEIIGGSIVVEAPEDFIHMQPPQIYGTGWSVLHLKQDFMMPHLKQGAHYWIKQINKPTAGA